MKIVKTFLKKLLGFAVFTVLLFGLARVGLHKLAEETGRARREAAATAQVAAASEMQARESAKMQAWREVRDDLEHSMKAAAAASDYNAVNNYRGALRLHDYEKPAE